MLLRMVKTLTSDLKSHKGKEVYRVLKVIWDLRGIPAPKDPKDLKENQGQYRRLLVRWKVLKHYLPQLPSLHIMHILLVQKAVTRSMQLLVVLGRI